MISNAQYFSNSDSSMVLQMVRPMDAPIMEDFTYRIQVPRVNVPIVPMQTNENQNLTIIQSRTEYVQINLNGSMETIPIPGPRLTLVNPELNEDYSDTQTIRVGRELNVIIWLRMIYTARFHPDQVD